MSFTKISLKNFRNFGEIDLEISPSINYFIGENGSGKTNFLESIAVFGNGKSFRKVKRVDLIKDGEVFFRIGGKINNIDYFLYYDKNTKYKVGENGVITSMSSFFNKIYPFVISRENFNLFYFSANERRKFFDRYISYFFKEYREIFLKFNKILRERNILLRVGYNKKTELEIWDKFYIKYAMDITKIRGEFIGLIGDKLKTIFSSIFSNKEVSIKYIPDFSEERFIKSKKNDFERKITTCGPQRDTYKMMIDGKDIIKFASQGQMKSYIISLIYVIILMFKEYNIGNGILLLDDIMEELDNIRKDAVFSIIKTSGFQTFFTTVEKEDIFKEGAVFKVEKGKIWQI